MPLVGKLAENVVAKINDEEPVAMLANIKATLEHSETDRFAVGAFTPFLRRASRPASSSNAPEWKHHSTAPTFYSCRQIVRGSMNRAAAPIFSLRRHFLRRANSDHAIRPLSVWHPSSVEVKEVTVEIAIGSCVEADEMNPVLFSWIGCRSEAISSDSALDSAMQCQSQ